MSETEPPLLVNALMAEGEPALAQVVKRLRFDGWCDCEESCTDLRTAPAGRADAVRVHLDGERAPRAWLRLDVGRTLFAGREILEFALGPHGRSASACQRVMSLCGGRRVRASWSCITNPAVLIAGRWKPRPEQGNRIRQCRPPALTADRSTRPGGRCVGTVRRAKHLAGPAHAGLFSAASAAEAPDTMPNGGPAPPQG